MASYTAGSASLKIFPDLQGFHTRLAQETRGVTVNVGVRTDQATIRAFQGELNGLTKNVTVNIGANGSGARSEIARVDSDARRFNGRTFTANLTANGSSAIRTVASTAVAINAFANKKYTFNLDADTSGAVASVLRLAGVIGALGGGIGVIGGLAGALGGIAPAAGGALLGIVPLVQAFSGVGKAVTALGAQQAAAGTDAQAAARQQAQAANSIITAQLAVTRAARSAREAQVDGAREIASAQKSAQQAVQQARDASVEAAKAVVTAQRDLRTAYQGVTDAQRDVKTALQGVIDAQLDARNASRDVQTAIREQELAQTDLASRTRDLKIAQDAINGAWVDGQRALQDLQDQMDGVNLDQRQNALDLKDAADNLAKVKTTGNTEGIARAQLAYDRLIEQQDVLRKRFERVNQENTEGQAAGVAGTAAVIAARQKIVDATDEQAQAQQKLADAGVAVRTAQERAAAADRAVAASRERVIAADAAVVASRERVALAEDNVTEAKQRAATASAAIDLAEQDGATNVALARESASRRIRSALESESDAERSLAQARLAAVDQANSSVTAVNKAFADLGPSQAAFARFWFGLKPFFDGLTESFGSKFFPQLQTGLGMVVGRGKELNGIYSVLGSTFGAAAVQILGYLTNPTWVAFFQFLAAQAQQYLPALITVFFQFADVIRILIMAFAPFAPQAIQLLSLFAQLLQVLAPVIAQFAGGLIPVAKLFIQALMPLAPLLQALMPVFQILGTVLANVLLVVLQALTPILIALTPLIAEFARQWGDALVKAIITLTPLIVTIFTFLSNNAQTVVTLTGFLLGFLGAMRFIIPVIGILVTWLAHFIIMRLITVYLINAGGALRILGLALRVIIAPISSLFSALGGLSGLMGRLPTLLLTIGRAFLGFLGPIGIVITIITVLYTTNAQFRDSINQLLGVILGLAGTLINSLLPPLMEVFNALAPLIPLIISSLVPVLNALIDVFVQILNAVLPPLIGILTGFVIPVIVTLANILATVLVWTVKNLVVPALQFLTGIIRDVVVPIILFLANSIVIPMFRLIGQFITYTWQSVLKPAFDAFVWILQNIVGPAIMFLWNNVFKPAFEGIGIAVQWAINNVVKPAIAGGTAVMDGFWHFIQDVVVPGIKLAWETLKAILAAPINFLIETVWNKGVVPAWRAVDQFLGGSLPDVVELNPIRLASGGPVRGAGGPTADRIPAMLSDGEFVVRASVAKRVMPYLRALNAGQAEALGAAGQGLRLAAGGVANAQHVAAQMAGKPYIWGGAGPAGADCSGFMSILTNALRGETNPYHRIGTTATFPWGGFTPGLTSQFAIGSNSHHMAGTLAGTNVEARQTGKPIYVGGPASGADNGQFAKRYSLPIAAGGFASGGGGGGFSIANPLAQGAKALVGTLGSAAKSAINTLASPPPEWMNVPKGVGNRLVDGTTGWVNTKIDQLFPPLAGAGPGGGAPAGSGPVVEQVRAVANRYGWGGGPQWAALSWLLNHESSWNPNAQNPSSSAYGLFQFLDSTWGSVGGSKTGNASQQAEYGMRYIKNRYQDPLGAQRFWQGHNWYDSGGWMLPGTGAYTNATGRPEPVLTEPQWGAVYTAARYAIDVAGAATRDVGRVGSGDNGTAALVGEYHAHFDGQTGSADAMRDLDHQLRVIRRRV